MVDAAVLLFDPHKLARECFRLVLKRTEFYVSDEAESIAEVLDALRNPEIELVVINLRGRFDEVADSVRAVRRISQSRIVVIGEWKAAAQLEETSGAKADGYVLHDYSADGLRESLRRVRAGEKVSPSRNRTVVAERALSLSDTEIETLVRVLVRRYGLPEPEGHSAGSSEAGEFDRSGGEWKRILAEIQTMKGVASPDYRH